MSEQDKAQRICVVGQEREEILQRFLAQIHRWGIALPPVEPLVLDFGLGRFEREGLIEYWIANEIQAGYCGKYLFLFDEQSCSTHHHCTKTETFFMVKGVMRVEYDGRTFLMNEGDVLRVAPRKDHCMTGIGPALFLELSTPCLVDDNYFSNTAIPVGGNYRPEDE